MIPFSDRWFTDIFFQSVACLSILLKESLTKQKFLILVKSNLLLFIDCAFDIMPKNSSPSPRI